MAAAIHPVEGEVCIVTPFFEDPSVRATLAVPASSRVRQEDQDPMATIAGYLRDRKLAGYPLGIGTNMRYVAFRRFSRVLPQTPLVPAFEGVRATRMIKSDAELALMQKATDVTIAAYRWLPRRIESGMTQDQVSALMDAATRKLAQPGILDGAARET